MKKVIITGANGFVGSYLSKALSNDGFDVTAVVRSKQSDITAISGIENIHIVYCELGNIENLPDMLEGEYDYFFHFAWDSSAGAGRSDVKLQLKNVELSCLAVKAAKKLGCKRFVFAGSIMEYEAKEYLFKDDSQPTGGYIYSIAKLTASMMAKTTAVGLGIEYIDAVISNIYGVGEKSMRFLNSTVHKILSGNDLQLTSCEQIYDFIYVTDAVEAIKIAALKGESSGSYYIGNVDQKQLKNFVQEIKEALGSDVKIEFGAVPFNGAYFNYKDVIDTGKVFRLGFKPSVCFNEGVKLLAESLKADQI